MIQELLQSPV